MSEQKNLHTMYMMTLVTRSTCGMGTIEGVHAGLPVLPAALQTASQISKQEVVTPSVQRSCLKTDA